MTPATLLLVLVAAASDLPPSGGPDLQPDNRAKWTCPDKAEKGLTYYPDRAWKKHIEGTANITCMVSPAGRVVSCSVNNETPPDWGFGEKAMHTACLLRLVPLSDPHAAPYSFTRTFRYAFGG